MLQLTCTSYEKLMLQKCIGMAYDTTRQHTCFIHRIYRGRFVQWLLCSEYTVPLINSLENINMFTFCSSDFGRLCMNILIWVSIFNMKKKEKKKTEQYMNTKRSPCILKAPHFFQTKLGCNRKTSVHFVYVSNHWLLN